MKKRNDLQGIRGVAILLVLLFHLNPTQFSFGFIGVDMFFVLSGYLITMITFGQQMSTSNVVEFYSKRFKRIVPIFTLNLTIVYAASFILLILPDRRQLLTDLEWSLGFLSNIQPLYEVKGYWDQVNAYRFLVHCWSLGVEIQFYAIAPFVLGYIKEKSHIRLPLLFCSSLLCQLCSTPKVAYGLLPSRIWQFLFGTVAFMLRQSNSTTEETRADNYDLFENAKGSYSLERSHRQTALPILRDLMITSVILAVIWTPPFLNETSVRIIGTAFTAFLIVISQPSKSSFLCSSMLVYIGDISYVLYLVHWPVIVFVKYHFNLKELGYFGTFWSLLIMFSITLVLHYVVEKQLLSSDIAVGCVLTVSGVFLIAISLPQYLKEDPIPSETLRKAIEFNEFESTKVYFELPCSADPEAEMWTNFRDEPQLRCKTTGRGKLNILVLGNSIAYRAFPLIHKLLKRRYKELRLFSRSACPPISNYCPAFTQAAHTVVEKMKPDVIFMMHAATEVNFTGPVHDWKTDLVFSQFQQNINFYSNHSRRTIIDTPYYIHQEVRVAYEIVKRLKLGKSLEDLQVTLEDSLAQQYWHQERVKRLNCSNCKINNLDEVLYDTNGVHYLYNRTNLLAYTYDGCHFTPAGLELLKPRYEQIVEDILKVY